jgi:fructokinase
MSGEAPLIAAIEAGGTKFNCALGRGPGEILETVRIPTTEPKQTLEEVGRWLSLVKSRHGAFAAIGVGCFGPVDLDEKSQTYGYITTTPKPGWQNTDVLGGLKNRFQVPMAFDTDVNGAALGEYLWGAGQQKDPLVYVTIGTGVGGGVLVNGRLLHGLLHPEIGHMQVPPPKKSKAVMRRGQCPFHAHCVEGYVSGPAIAKRWGVRPERLPVDSPAWEEVGEVLAYLCMNLTLTLSPKRIILGGGVMEQEQVLSMVHGAFIKLMNGYIRQPEMNAKIGDYITRPMLGANAGLLGALALGRRAPTAAAGRA